MNITKKNGIITSKLLFCGLGNPPPVQHEGSFSGAGDPGSGKEGTLWIRERGIFVRATRGTQSPAALSVPAARCRRSRSICLCPAVRATWDARHPPASRAGIHPEQPALPKADVHPVRRRARLAACRAVLLHGPQKALPGGMFRAGPDRSTHGILAPSSAAGRLRPREEAFMLRRRAGEKRRRCRQGACFSQVLLC